MTTPDLADALQASAARIGVDPSDYATGISYETGGTFNLGICGEPGSLHIGLIRFGPAEEQAQGANQGQTFVAQLPAVERYLVDRGFERGSGRLYFAPRSMPGDPACTARAMATAARHRARWPIR